MILGISAGGQSNGQTAQMIKALLEQTGMEYEFISLSNKTILGCSGCLNCATTGKCSITKDDWNDIADKMLKADAIVFGAPAYCGNINAVGHAFLERTYALRHGRFQLGRRYAVVVTPNGNGNPAQQFAEKIFSMNKMAILDSFGAGCSRGPCFHCGCGEDCMVGCVVRGNDFEPVKEITEDMYQSFATSESAQRRVKAAAWTLSRAVENKVN
jgi:multimeric flavodoxin WrbA